MVTAAVYEIQFSTVRATLVRRARSLDTNAQNDKHPYIEFDTLVQWIKTKENMHFHLQLDWQALRATTYSFPVGSELDKLVDNVVIVLANFAQAANAHLLPFSSFVAWRFWLPKTKRERV